MSPGGAIEARAAGSRPDLPSRCRTPGRVRNGRLRAARWGHSLDVAHRHQHDVPAEPAVGLAGVVEEQHHRLVLLGQGGEVQLQSLGQPPENLGVVTMWPSPAMTPPVSIASTATSHTQGTEAAPSDSTCAGIPISADIVRSRMREVAGDESQPVSIASTATSHTQGTEAAPSDSTCAGIPISADIVRSRMREVAGDESQ